MPLKDPKDPLAHRVQDAVDAGDLQKALVLCRAQLSENKNDTAAFRHLGTVYALLGNRAKALDAAARATELAPENPHTWNDRGRVYALFEDFSEAIDAFHKSVALDPLQADAWHNLGLAHKKSGKAQLAFDAFKRALKVDVARSDSYLHLGELLLTAGQRSDALGCFERAVKFESGRTNAARGAGRLLLESGALEEARFYFQKAIDSDPSDADSWFGLGRTFEDCGKREDAAGAYRNAVAHAPVHGLAISHLIGLGVTDADGRIASKAKMLLHDPQTPDETKAFVGYGLAKLHDRQGDYRLTADVGRIANNARRRISGPLDRQTLDARVEGVQTTYDRAFFSRRLGWGLRSTQPVFIVGLPRSGTTLVEQILSAHPKIAGAGELPDLPQLANRFRRDPSTPPWKTPAEITHDDASAAAESYLTALRRQVGASQNEPFRISDKSPLNFFNLAFAAILFPNAKVIHCSRDIRDNAISIWLENFSSDQSWATDFGDLAYFVKRYRALMSHWRAVLPLPILEVQYEDTVANVDVTAKRIISFLDVQWDDRCTDFHRNDRAVQTPSRWQVRKPIYNSSIDRWRHYQSHLPELNAIMNDALY